MVADRTQWPADDSAWFGLRSCASPIDPFGVSTEDKAKRRLIADYEAWMKDIGSCEYRKLKLGRSGGEVHQGWRVI
jgi:hypothetical protein